MQITPQTTPPASRTRDVSVDPQDEARELVGQELTAIEVLLDLGDRRAATAALRSLLRRSSAELAEEILRNAAAAELARGTGWVEPRRRDVRFVPPGRVRVRREQTRISNTDGRGRAGDAVRDAAGDAEVAAYLAAQPPAEVDPRTGWDVPVWGALDYDRVAVPALRGAPCPGCQLERTPADRANPDGLCVDCRDTSGLTRERVIARRCELVVAAHPAARATELLRAAWSRAGRPADRQVIAAWVAQHQTLLTPASGSGDVDAGGAAQEVAGG